MYPTEVLSARHQQLTRAAIFIRHLQRSSYPAVVGSNKYCLESRGVESNSIQGAIQGVIQGVIQGAAGIELNGSQGAAD